MRQNIPEGKRLGEYRHIVNDLCDDDERPCPDDEALCAGEECAGVSGFKISSVSGEDLLCPAHLVTLGLESKTDVAMSCPATGGYVTTPRVFPIHLPTRDQLLNVIGLFEDSRPDDPGWKVETARDEVLDTFAGFHPKFKAVLAALDERVLNDAAHTTLPTLAQGAAMAIETGALKILFPASTTSADIPVQLAAYEELRRRVSHHSPWEAKVFNGIRYHRGDSTIL
ncbi:hypothetical protein B0H13DRAFT_2398606 [Mycena leptocephala]|nr:hypothetical protein B0H13DRAFT_2398606 [Mycena leptocephala]